MNQPITTTDITLSTDKINNLIQNTNNLLQCDDACQRREHIDTLRKKWLSAKEVKENAPINVEDAERNLYVFKDGEEEYKQFLLERYKKQALKTKNESLKSNHEFINEIRTYCKYYHSQIDSFNKLKNYLNIKKTENKKLKLELENIIASVQTNDRRSVYEKKNINYIKIIYNIIIVIFFITSIIYLIYAINKYYINNNNIYFLKDIITIIILYILFFIYK